MFTIFFISVEDFSIEMIDSLTKPITKPLGSAGGVRKNAGRKRTQESIRAVDILNEELQKYSCAQLRRRNDTLQCGKTVPEIRKLLLEKGVDLCLI